jgi:hypothetical protein
MSMSEDEQRIALCEWMGWRRLDAMARTVQWCGRWEPGNPNPVETSTQLPNTNSLDVLHGFELKLTREQQEEYANQLYLLLPEDENHGNMGDGVDIMTASQFQMLHAKAEFRREALLRTLNLWQEPKP